MKIQTQSAKKKKKRLREIIRVGKKPGTNGMTLTYLLHRAVLKIRDNASKIT